MTTEVGQPPWSRDELIAALPEFEAVYAERPIQDNLGGMKAPHMFAVWFIARWLEPEVVIESGVFRGQSTWLFERALPDARIISIDIDLSARDYISSRATYHDQDFATLDWSELRGDRTLAFFDDHQNAYVRMQQCRWLGLRHVIFEDNYPASVGDCYSLKKVLAGAGFTPTSSEGRRGLASQLAAMISRRGGDEDPAPGERIAPNMHDAAMLVRNLELYCEFPPVFTRDQTRWGEDWARSSELSTPDPLLEPQQRDRHPVLWEEAEHYTWICYARLKP